MNGIGKSETKGQVSQRPARVMIVDDHPLVREGLAQLLNRQSDMTCCAQADSYASALKCLETERPDLMTVDIRLQNGDGLDIIKAVRNTHPSLAALVISQCDEVLYAERALKAGARGYLMKERATEEVLAAIRTVLGGGIYVSPKIAMLVLQNVAGARPVQPNHTLANLSDRELQVLQLLGSGLSSKKVAEKLFLSIKTVETHRENIKHKLGLANAPDLIWFATNWVSGLPSQHMDVPSGLNNNPNPPSS